MKRWILKWLGMETWKGETLITVLKAVGELSEKQKTTDGQLSAMRDWLGVEKETVDGLFGKFSRNIDAMMFGLSFKPLTIRGRIEEIEKKQRLIMDYLGLETHTEAERTFIRKKKGK